MQTVRDIEKRRSGAVDPATPKVLLGNMESLSAGFRVGTYAVVRDPTDEQSVSEGQNDLADQERTIHFVIDRRHTTLSQLQRCPFHNTHVEGFSRSSFVVAHFQVRHTHTCTCRAFDAGI